jgi:glycogen debranching enzyme
MQFMAQRLGMEGDEKRWHEMAERLHQAINLDLWNGSAGCYQDRRVPGGFVDASTSSLFWPLFARVSDDERAAGLIEMLRDPRRFRLDAGVPSVAVDDPCYSNDMHRGPVWPAMNAMIAEGLAAYGADELAVDLRQRTLSAIARWYRATGCFWEFYDGQDVRPPASLERKSHRSYGGGQGNIADHHVTAAVFTKLCHEVFG